MPKPEYKDNKGYYNGSDRKCRRFEPEPPEIPGTHEPFSIRVPSMKRGRSTWKRFYMLFPELRYTDTYRGHKLKKI